MLQLLLEFTLEGSQVPPAHSYSNEIDEVNVELFDNEPTTTATFESDLEITTKIVRNISL